jgi:hypothetical protein
MKEGVIHITQNKAKFTQPDHEKRNEPKTLPRYPLSLRWQKYAKQSQISAFSIKNHGLLKKQSQFASCLYIVLPNEPKRLVICVPRATCPYQSGKQDAKQSRS